ncbi:MAG: PAS domain-containing protein, partial [Gemmatimonadales bacterium]
MFTPFALRPTDSPGILRRYGVALAAVLVGAAATTLMDALTRSDHPIAAYLAAILVTGWFAGTGPAVFALALVVVLDWWLPTLGAGPVGWSLDIRELWFLLFTTAAAWFGAVRQRARVQLETTRDQLEDEVAERTGELQKTATYLDEAQRLTGVGSWVLSLDAVGTMYWSDGLYRVLGADPASIAPHLDLGGRVHPEDRARRISVVETAIRDATPFKVNYRIVRPDGSVRFIKCAGRPRFDDRGVAVEFVGAMMDITANRHTQRMLRRTRARAMLAHFSATLAERSRLAREMHDTLLQGFTGIALQLVAVANRVTDDPETERDLREVIQSATRTLEEAREAIADLRDPWADSDVADTLRAAAQQVLRSTGMTFDLQVVGGVRPL